ncbi:hypothetical protein [uncultured Campylobacter sp.]|nr:hypothetical protein [uncultured Campylobacter sp.]
MRDKAFAEFKIYRFGLDSVLRQSGGAMSGEGLSCGWLAAYGLSRGDER